LWKAELIDRLSPRPHQLLLDIAGGTGDIARHFLARAGTGATALVLDLTPAMLEHGRDRAIDDGVLDGIQWICGDAERLPVASSSVDACTIAFGLRNVTHIAAALSEARRVLKPGGRFGIVVPGLRVDVATEGIPPHLQPFWHWDFVAFHSPEWWRRHWEKTGLLQVEQADWVPDGWRHWLAWMEICADRGQVGADPERLDRALAAWNGVTTAQR